VALHGDSVAVGAPWGGDGVSDNDGSTRSGTTTWSEDERLTASDGVEVDFVWCESSY